MSGWMQGKRAFVTGVANDRSIAWAIARQFHAEGAELAFSYPGEAMGKRTIPLVQTLNPAAILDLDVSDDARIDAAVREVGKVWDSVDVLVHSIGYAPREALDGRFTDVTTREAWRITLDVSAYSLVP
jgi:enoyl-[acyl-carrier protein] reductase I